MKIVNMVLITIIALLSIAAGVAKVMAVPEEVQFLESFGFSVTLISAYGLCQILGGFLFALPKTRIVGAVITIAAFALSTVLIFISGNLTFGVVSIVPIALASMVVFLPRLTTHSKRVNPNSP